MSEKDGLHHIEARCREILASPYLYRDLPEELQRLRILLKTVDTLAREDVPHLVDEVKRLRAENKQLTAHAAQAASPALAETDAPSTQEPMDAAVPSAQVPVEADVPPTQIPTEADVPSVQLSTEPEGSPAPALSGASTENGGSSGPSAL